MFTNESLTILPPILECIIDLYICMCSNECGCTHALHRSTLHNKFIQFIRSEFVMFYLNENPTSCINESFRLLASRP